MCLLFHLNLLPLLPIFCSITLKGRRYPGNTHSNHMFLHLQQQVHMWLQTEKLVSILTAGTTQHTVFITAVWPWPKLR